MQTSLYLQVIRTTWTKKSRGGELAGPRNAVPLALPVEYWQTGCLSVRCITYSESDVFQTPTTIREQLDLTNALRFNWGSFALNWDEQIAKTEFHPADWSVGAPGIKSFAPIIGQFIVADDEWVRLRWQGRFSDYDDGRWWYEHTCINVARFDGEINPNIFLQGEPTKQFVHLPILK